jgi:hypothetical protein
MAKVPAFVKAFAGRWRIVETDVWDNDFLDEVEEAHITREALTARSLSALSTAVLMFAMAPATARPMRSSPGKASTTAKPPAVAVGQPWALPVVSQATSISIKATTQPSSANGDDFFNTLLVCLLTFYARANLPWLRLMQE